MTTEIKKSRLIFFCFMAAVIFGLIVFRLVNIQLVYGDNYSEIALRQTTGRREIPAPRGIIYDRFGRELTINVQKYSLFAHAENADEISRIHAYLDSLLEKPRGYSRRTYSVKPKKFTWLERRFPDSLAKQVEIDTVRGLYIDYCTGRSYPFLGVGKQLLGWTNVDGKGVAGMEYSFDTLLAGRPGYFEYLRDGQRNTYRLRNLSQIPPVPGKSITLTVDWNLQEIVEDELEKGVEKYKALEGNALFIDCHTGEILAAADFVANGKNDAVKLRAISNRFEPGSVFKVFTAAALLDENLVDLNERVNCENGVWKVNGRLLRDDKKHGLLNLREIIERSSNIGIGKLALRLGADRLYETARRFGFGQRYYVGLPGEESGVINHPDRAPGQKIAANKKKKSKPAEYNIAALSMGHSISVTALQLANAVAAIANGGTLYRPKIIKAITTPDGKVIEQAEVEKIATVMKASSAEILRSYMKGVVDTGTAKPVKSDIVSIAGKTGTAEVVDTISGGYKKNKFVASFLGFFPYESPRVAGVVILHEPEPIHYGGYTAGPIFKQIAERYSNARIEQFKPDNKIIASPASPEFKTIPDFVGHEVTQALSMARHRGLELVMNAASGTITWQFPPAGRKITGKGKVAVGVSMNETDSLVMADLTGLNLRTAVSFLDFLGYEYEIEGEGMVLRHEPPPGEILSGSTRCLLICGKGLTDADSAKKSN